jgi:hypothetical protein
VNEHIDRVVVVRSVERQLSRRSARVLALRRSGVERLLPACEGRAGLAWWRLAASIGASVEVLGARGDGEGRRCFCCKTVLK